MGKGYVQNLGLKDMIRSEWQEAFLPFDLQPSQYLKRKLHINLILFTRRFQLLTFQRMHIPFPGSGLPLVAFTTQTMYYSGLPLLVELKELMKFF